MGGGTPSPRDRPGPGPFAFAPEGTRTGVSLSMSHRYVPQTFAPPGPSPRPSIRFRFFLVMGLLFAAMDGVLAVFVIRWDRLPSVILFGVLSMLFFGSSYGLAREILALTLPPVVPASMVHLPRKVRVAILYATMNDVVPECLRAIHQTYPSDVYVLDDSSDPAQRAVVDAIARERRYVVVRRGGRRGYKAGAINDWLRAFGDRYDYLVLLDADSYLPQDWVAEALRYAEHPDNARVAIFQGLINIWNLDSEFARILAPMARVGQYVWEERLGNAVDAVFCYGHNVLVRTAALRPVGGFMEGFVSEDFATAVALADRGWHSRFLPLHSYEAVPENVRGFLKRQKKWTRGAMEFFGFARRSSLSPGQKVILLETPWSHVTTLLLPLGMFLTIYGYSSTPGAALGFLHALLADPLGTLWAVPILRFVLVLSVLTAIPKAILWLRCGIGASVLWKHRWLTAAVSAIALPYEFLAMVGYLLTGFRTIPVTPKSEAPLTPGEVLSLARYTLLLAGALLVGIVALNPLGGLFNATWIIPMLLSPAVVLHYSGPPERIAPFLDPNPLGPFASGVSHPADVHGFLVQLRTGLPSAPPPPAPDARPSGNVT